MNIIRDSASFTVPWTNCDMWLEEWKEEKGNPDSPWAKARLRWVTQLLIRLGKRDFDSTEKENE
jgi:hypothetical protein